MDSRLLVVTIAIFAVLVVICLLPAVADRRDDLGDGMTSVRIPRYVKTPAARPRTWLFMAVCAALGLLFLGLRRPSAAAGYAGLVRALASAITRDPAVVNGYVARLLPATGFLAVAYLIGISLVVRASPARRLCHAVPRAAVPRDVGARAGAADHRRDGERLADRPVRGRGDAGQPAHRRARRLPPDVQHVRTPAGDEGAPAAPLVDLGQRAGLVRAHQRGGGGGGGLHVPGRAGQPDLGLAGVHPAVRAEHPVRASVRALVAALVGALAAARAGRRPARGRRDHPGFQRGGEPGPAAAVG